MARKCPSCSESNKIIEEEGSLICSNCGLLLEEEIFESGSSHDYSQQFPSKIQSSRPSGKHSFPVVISSENRGLIRLKASLFKASSILALGSHFEASLQLFENFLQNSTCKSLFGQKGLLLAYGALFVVSGAKARGISIGEFASKLAVDKYKLGASIRQMHEFLVNSTTSAKESSNEGKYLQSSNEIPSTSLSVDDASFSSGDSQQIPPEIASFFNEICALLGFSSQQKHTVSRLYWICKRELLLKGARALNVKVMALAWLQFLAIGKDSGKCERITLDGICKRFGVPLASTTGQIREFRHSLVNLIKHLPWSNDITPKNIHFYLQDVCKYGKLTLGDDEKEGKITDFSESTAIEPYNEEEFDDFITESILVTDAEELKTKERLLFDEIKDSLKE